MIAAVEVTYVCKLEIIGFVSIIQLIFILIRPQGA